MTEGQEHQAATQNALRYYIHGPTSPWPEALPRAQCSSDPAAEADAVLILEGAATDGLMDLLARHDKALLPIANFSRRRFRRADFTSAVLSEAALAEFVTAARTILGQLEEIPPPAAPADRPALEAMAMAWSREAELCADWYPTVPEAVAYPLLEGIPISREILEDMAGGDLLRRRPFDTLHPLSLRPSGAGGRIRAPRRRPPLPQMRRRTASLRGGLRPSGRDLPLRGLRACQ